MIIPNGIEPSDLATGIWVYIGTINEGGGVKVGRRVFVGTMINCAAKVGSIVAVAGDTGVGGGSITFKVPGETCTRGEYTHPLS